MPHHAETTRREPRYKLRRGIAFVEFEIDDSCNGPRRGDLTSVSVAGLTFEVDADAGLEKGTLVQAATVLIGECAVEGEFAVRYIRLVNESRVETGCLFYPTSHTGAEKWSAVIAVTRAHCAD